MGTQNGTGGVALYPFRMLFNDMVSTGAAWLPGIITTANAYANDDFRFANTSGILTADLGVSLNGYCGYSSPFFFANFNGTSGKMVRLVASGIKVQYQGKVLDNSGTYVCVSNPYALSGLPATRDMIQDLMAIPGCAQGRITDAPVYASYKPAMETDSQFMVNPCQSAAGYMVSSATDTSILNRLGSVIGIVGAETNAKFTFEAIAYFEIRGPSTTLTVSHSDPVGAAVVSNQAHMLPPSTAQICYSDTSEKHTR